MHAQLAMLHAGAVPGGEHRRRVRSERTLGAVHRQTAVDAAGEFFNREPLKPRRRVHPRGGDEQVRPQPSPVAEDRERLSADPTVPLQPREMRVGHHA